jgi:hypothetical protein
MSKQNFKDSFNGLPDDKRLLVQMHKDMWDQLKFLAYKEDVSMAQLCREGIKILLQKKKTSLKENS